MTVPVILTGKTFSIRLRQALQSQNIPAAKLARDAGIEVSQLSKYMSGHKEPGFRVLRKIVEHLPNVDARALIVGVQNGS